MPALSLIYGYNNQAQTEFFEKLSLIGCREERNFITENLSLMIGAGMSIPSALESILKGIKNKTLAKIIKLMIKDLDEGSKLHAALARTNLLPSYALSLIEIGEESGRLAENLQAVAMQQEKDETLNSKLHSAMIYPILVLSITTIVGLGVAWFILPKLAKVFLNLKLTLPLITKIMISFANVLNRQGYWLIPAIGILIFVLIYIVFYNRRTNVFGQWLLLSLPVTRKMIVNLELSRLGYIMSGLLSAGIPIQKTVAFLRESSQIYRYQKFYFYLAEGFEVGNSFKTSFEKYPKMDKLIPPPIQQIIVSGEQSGKLAASLALVGNRYEEKTEQSIKNLPVVLEPIFLILIWLGVLVVALAVILPIYSLVGNLNNTATHSTIKK